MAVTHQDLEHALAHFRRAGRVSAGELNRQAGVPFRQAAAVMCRLEALGVVGPERGIEPREILVDLASYQLPNPLDMCHADKKPTRAKRAAPRSPALRSGDMVGGASPAAEIKPYEPFFTLQYTIWCGATDICHTDNSTRAELCQLAITQFMRSQAGRAWMKRQRTPNIKLS